MEGQDCVTLEKTDWGSGGGAGFLLFFCIVIFYMPMIWGNMFQVLLAVYDQSNYFYYLDQSFL